MPLVGVLVVVKVPAKRIVQRIKLTFLTANAVVLSGKCFLVRVLHVGFKALYSDL